MIKNKSDKLKVIVSEGVTLIKSQVHLLSDKVKRVGAASVAFLMVGTFSGCSSSSNYNEETITGDTGILNEVSDETLLDNVLELKAYSDLYTKLQFIENDLKYYDDIDLKSIEATLESINIKEEEPYNNQSLEKNIASYNDLNEKYKKNELNSDEVHDLYITCETLKKQKEGISKDLTTTTWDTIYGIGNLVIKATFMDALDMNKNNLSDNLESISIYESSDDSEILTCTSITREDLSKNYTIKKGTLLDELYDELELLNNNKVAITTKEIKEVLNQIKEIIANQFYVSYRDNCVDKMDESKVSYDTKCAKAKVLQRNR